ncbi:hypothetical protein LCGC14_1482830 [marine sediment metagenome]|uniref:Uncharacterized protein n=1 Tax=marine sediment metagenome TaxID=412755 RepID=A0A0F9J9Q6_9ZZZZ
MTIKKTIEKAIEGGWIKELKYEWRIRENSFEVYVDKGFFYPNRWFHVMRIETILLDPSFWRALGKSMEWARCKASWQYEKGFTIKNGKDSAEWVIRWHQFIDHLAEGGTPESYFEKLT